MPGLTTNDFFFEYTANEANENKNHKQTQSYIVTYTDHKKMTVQRVHFKSKQTKKNIVFVSHPVNKAIYSMTIR